MLRVVLDSYQLPSYQAVHRFESPSLQCDHVEAVRQYEFPIAQERTFLRSFYRLANKTQFDVEKYNSLKTKAAQLQRRLQMLGAPHAETEWQLRDFSA
ncbi:unnamed protein product [Soboliphyme baturini]|uniref:Transposase n=1 Tax=Soboliphyme baturini TaxID=241478 RepID=A0A183IXQ3_9BILA|nr:unnamed protein product [Soboliphyme baturini]